MYGDFVLMEKPAGETKRAQRLPLGDTGGRNEAWLRDTLFSNPDLLPINDIDASLGPLLPPCRELRTEAGPLDIAFISASGRLTLVECKLWRNPEARRKVVAQVLDYARAISRWSYSDLQRQVSMATGKQGNLPFEIAQAFNPTVVEHQFADAVMRTMRSGRFLLLIAGDGIREDVDALAELINRNAAMGFSFGLIEVALYELGSGGLAVQPRVTARTHVFERNVVVIQGSETTALHDVSEEPVSLDSSQGTVSAPVTGSANANGKGENTKHAEYRVWWQPVTDMSFDDPDQDAPKLYWPNHVRVPLPWPGTWLTAYRVNAPTGGRSGVLLAGRQQELAELLSLITPRMAEIMSELPEGTELGQGTSPGITTLFTTRPDTDFQNDDQKRDWLRQTLNQYVNALRPRLKQLTP
jgi:hypothetical protein